MSRLFEMNLKGFWILIGTGVVYMKMVGSLALGCAD
jgi:hypothetical protein